MRVAPIKTNYVDNQAFQASNKKDSPVKIAVKSGLTIPAAIFAMSVLLPNNSCTKADVFEYQKDREKRDSIEVADSVKEEPPFNIVVDTTYNEIIHDIILFDK